MENEIENKPENPQAFPSKVFHPVSGNLIGQEEGMTLRDYFAAKAINGLIQSGSSPKFMLAMEAYRIADAMLKERTKP